MAIDLGYKSERLLDLIKGKKIDRPPVWVMRQAGRYLPEFRKIRENYNFFEMINNSDIASEITIQPLLRYQMDAAIIFSDILILLQAIGIDVQLITGKGIVISNPIQNIKQARLLQWDFNPQEKFNYLTESIKLTVKKINGACPLIGFAGAPITLMSYMTNTSSINNKMKDFSEIRKWLYKSPLECHEILNNLSNGIVQLLISQYKAGADILMLFESHGELMNEQLFKLFSFKYLNQIAKDVWDQLNIKVPFIVFVKGAPFSTNYLMESPYFKIIGIDWSISIENVLSAATKYDKIIMGNLDPACLYSTHENIEKETQNILNICKNNRYVANLGHGMYPDLEPEKLNTFVKTIKNFRF